MKRHAEDQGSNRYWGAPWPSGICDGGTQVATPIGIACALCAEPIAADDQGSFIGTMTGPAPVHRECSLRSALGGIEHLTAGPHVVGTCYEGSTLTYRQSALAAWDWIQTHGFPSPQAYR